MSAAAGPAMLSRPNWSRPLPKPLKIPGVMNLKTLADVRELLKHIPKERRQNSVWQVVVRRLDDAAAGRGTVDDVSIALQMALQLERVEYQIKKAAN